MAKGNPFLGMARGSVGDVTLYRKNGEQVSRARNRKPSNPKTNPQLYQRAIMATVLRAYSAGKVIFDHSFQGKKVGEGNQREFLSRNLRELRSQIVSADPSARVVAPKSTVPVANRYIIASGTLAQTPFGRALNTLVGEGMSAGLSMMQPLNAEETFAAYAARADLVPGDIYTICSFGMNSDYPITSTDFGTDGTQYLGGFGYLQFKLKTWTDETAAKTVANVTFAEIFEIYANNLNADELLDATITEFSGQSLETRIRPVNIVGDGFNYGSIGTIRSRDNDGARCNCTMQMVGQDEYGITSDWLLDVWSAAPQLGDSSLVLEGSNFPAGA